jgi:hypothetical protein
LSERHRSLKEMQDAGLTGKGRERVDFLLRDRAIVTSAIRFACTQEWKLIDLAAIS